MMKRLKRMTTEQVLRSIAGFLGRASDRDFEYLLAVMDRLATSHREKTILQTLRDGWRNNSPLAQLLRRVFREANPECRYRFLYNLFFNQSFGEAKVKRDTYTERYGYRPPWAMLISPTMRCNLRCAGCYAGEYTRKDDLPAEVIDRVLTEGEEMGISFVTILGGEPFIREDLWPIYEKHRDTLFQIYANGTLLDEETVGRIARLGNIVPAVSIEGFEEETDGRRGKGTFQAIMRAMDSLRQHGIIFGFSAMVTRYNVDTIISDAFNDMLVEKGAYLGWHFLYMPVGRDPDLSLMPTPEQRDLLRRMGAARIRATRPMFVMDFWNDAPYVGGCIAAGRDYFHITSRGDVEPCIFTHFAVDNIKEKSLKEVLESPFFRGIRARQPYSQNLLRPCMLIDHPHVFREIYQAYHPYPTHPGAETLVGELAAGLDRYSQEAAAILEEAWRKDFIEGGINIFPEETPSREPMAM
ncbi:MAG: radical SAM protein [Anaerolineae bacterium]